GGGTRGPAPGTPPASPRRRPPASPRTPRASSPTCREPPPKDPPMNFGTFLLMQSPSARSSKEIYARAVDVAQAAERLGFNNIWLAEHHFSTYGYLSRPVQLATYISAKTTRRREGTAVIMRPL